MSTPSFRIVADGSDVTEAIKDRLLSIRITDKAGQQSDSLEVTVDDREKRMPIPRSGAWLRIWLGYTTPVYMGAFAVDEVDVSNGPRSMVIKATAAQTAPELVREQRTQAWHNTTLKQVVEEIAKRNGLKAVIKGSLGSIQIKHEDQTNESDQAFLTRLAERYKATIKPADGSLVVAPRGSAEMASTASATPLASGGTVTPGQATALAQQAGFRGNDAVIMGAIAMAESSGRIRAHNTRPPDNSYGLWQINMIGSLGPSRRTQLGISSNEALFDPATNARAARTIYQQQGFGAWSVYRSGAYKAFLGRAAQGVTGLVGGVPSGNGQTFAIQENEVTTWRATLKNRGSYGQVKTRWLDRTTNKEQVKTVGEAGGLPAFEEKQLFKSEAEADAAAQSRLQSLKSGEVRISITMPGRPELNADGAISLKGFRDEVDGTWVTKEIVQNLDRSGYTTSIECGTQGEENESWSTGSGANDGLAAGPKAKAIANGAASARGMNTRGGPDGGNNACVYAVNKVLRSSGVTPPWGNSNYVPNARAALAGGAGTLLSGPEPGAIAIMRDNGNPPYPHIGIVQNDGSIISNSSSRGTFSWVASPASYTSFYGRTPEYWRLK